MLGAAGMAGVHRSPLWRWLIAFSLMTGTSLVIPWQACAAGPTGGAESGASLNEVSLEVEARKAGKDLATLKRGILVLPKTSDYVWNKYVNEVGVREGVVRLALDLERVRTPSDLDREIEGLERYVEKVKTAGGEPLIFLYGVPVALSRPGPPSFARGRSPRRFEVTPKNLAAWRDLVRKVVLHFNRDKRLPIRYLEVWNEPDRPEFWSGTQEDFFEVCRATVEGARSADPTIRVGGPSTSSWSGAIGQQGPLIKNFLEFAQRNRMPLDFISWHAFEKDPSLLRGAVKEIQGWKRSFGFPDAELVVDEWNYGTPSLEREGPIGAAFAGAMMAAIFASGIDRQAFAMLQDVEIARADFGGDDWGLFTLSGIAKPVYNALRAASMLGNVQLDVSQKGGEHFISAVAARGEDSVGVLITNFPPQDPLARVAAFFFYELGYAPEDLRGWGVDERTVKELLKPDGEAVVDRLRAPAKAKSDLKKALAYYRRLDQETLAGGGRWSVRLAIKNLPFQSRVMYERYVTDGRNGNSFAARDKIAGRLAALQNEARAKALDAVEQFLTAPDSRQASRGPLLGLLAEVRPADPKQTGRLLSQFRRKNSGAVLEDLNAVEALFARTRMEYMRKGLDEVNKWPEVSLTRAEAVQHENVSDVATAFHVQPYSVILVLLKGQVGRPRVERGRP